MRADNSEHLKAARRADSQLKVKRVQAVIAEMEATGTRWSASELAERAKVSRRFLYYHPELLAEFRNVHSSDASARVAVQEKTTVASLQAELAYERAQRIAAKEEVEQLRRRVGALLGAQHRDTAASDHESRSEAARLAREVEALEQQLERCQVDLQAARDANRDLMVQLNRLHQT